MRRRSATKVSTAARRSDTDKKFNTCYEYFKVKKSPISVESRVTSPKSVKETCSSLIEVNKIKTKDEDLSLTRPRRSRYDSLKQGGVKQHASSGLCIEDVQTLVAAQDSYDGGVNCYVCGKLYKSKVCFIKHIWEHTVYWDIFERAKNHERVLSIQAAIILYCGMTSQTNGPSKPDLCNLLVTSPHSSEMKQERDNGVTPNNDQLNNSLLVLLSEKCAEKPPLAVGNGKEKSDVNGIEHLLHDGATKHTEDVASHSQGASSDSCIQMLTSSTGECYCQPWSHITYPRSQVSPTLQMYPTLSSAPPELQSYPAVFSPPTRSQNYPSIISPPTYPTQFFSPPKSQTYPTVFSPPTKPQCYPTLSSPQSQMCPIFSLPLSKPQIYPILSPERPCVVMLGTSLPAQQLSPDACQGYKNSRQTSTDNYGTLESSGVSFVSPLKRKRED